MATTFDAFRNDPGVNFVWVVTVEGIDVLLTNGDPDAVATAYAGTEWASSTVVPGLQVKCKSRQQLRPWGSATVNVTHMSFAVMDTDGSDTFGKLVFGSGAGFETFQNGAIDNNDATVTVLSNSTFAASGPLYMGAEHVTYSAKGGSTTFTGCTRGRFAPFKANTESEQRFGRQHRQPSIGAGIVRKPIVSSLPRTWVGRWVRLQAHRDVAGTLDTFAEGHCVFGGRIIGVRDEANGLTYVECDSAQGAIRDCTLLTDQWTAKAQEGIYLRRGWKFDAEDGIAGTPLYANSLKVVEEGTAGTNEIEEGYYTREELADVLNDWLLDEKVAARLGMTWTWEPEITDEDSDGEIRSGWTFSDASAAGTNIAIFYAPRKVLQFMGWENPALGAKLNFVWEDDAERTFPSNDEPYRTLITSEDVNGSTGSTVVSDIVGTWLNNRSRLPAELQVAFGSIGDSGIVQANGGAWLFAERISSTQFVLRRHSYLDRMSGVASTNDGNTYLRVLASEPGDVTFRQVVLLSGRCDTLLTTLLASTGTSGYNHATYDALPAQLGAAIPWQLLGDTWTQSFARLPQSDAAVVIKIDKPTKLIDLIGCELSARQASILWRKGALFCASWRVPSAAISAHSFTEETKAAPGDTRDAFRTVANDDDEWMVNTVKIEFNASGSSYTDYVTIADPGSIDEHGSGKPITISARNTYSEPGGESGAVSELAAAVAQSMGILSKPVRVLQRSIDQNYAEGVTPGEVCTITDSFVRDPLTGERGVSNKPGLIISHSWDWGGYEIDSESTAPQGGAIEILILPRDRVVAYCPAAQVDDTATNGGYNAGTSTLTFYAHKHSETSASVDVSHFSASDTVTIVEIDPDNPDPAGYNTWDRTIQSVNTGANTVTLTSGLSSPAWDSARRYRMYSQNYSTATTGQRAKVFQADDADGMVSNTVTAYEYGAASGLPTETWTTIDGDEQARLIPTDIAVDGAPLDTGTETDRCILVNNLSRFRTAPIVPYLHRNVMSGSGVSKIVSIIPFYPGKGYLTFGDRRLYLRPWFRSTDGSTATVWVSLCSKPPYGSSFTITDASSPTYRLNGEYERVSWTSTSTTWGAGTLDSVSLRVIDPSKGEGYIVIEAADKTETRGLALCQVGPWVES